MSKLATREVNFAYNGGPLVLKDIDMTLEAGEIIALVGPNGSGKSTLLKCLADFHTPKEGKIELKGEDIMDFSLNEKARVLGYVPQIEDVTFPSTVFDTILMGRKPYISWKPSKKDKKVVTDIIKKLGLEHIAMRDINELSGGQRQKVFIARALAQEPEILILDEPTSSLDLKHQLEVLSMIKKQSERGISVLLAMHDLNMAVRFSDKVVMLKEGKIFASGGMEIINSENIEKVYETKAYVGEHHGWPVITPDRPLKKDSGE